MTVVNNEEEAQLLGSKPVDPDLLTEQQIHDIIANPHFMQDPRVIMRVTIVQNLHRLTGLSYTQCSSLLRKIEKVAASR